MPKKTGPTPAYAFRFDAKTLAALDRLAAAKAAETRLPVNRADMLRLLIREAAERLRG